MKRLRAWWREFHWFVIAVLWLAALALGYAGFARHCAVHGLGCSGWDVLYLTFQLISMSSGAVAGPIPWQLEVARLLVPLLTLYAAVAGFALLFEQRLQLLRLAFVRDHIVICGAGRSGWRLAQGFRRQGEQVVVVERDEGNDWLEACRSLGAIVLTGDAASGEVLRRAAVQRARWLIAVCGRDGTNAEVAVRARALTADRPGRVLTCVIQIADPALCELLRQWELGAEALPTFRLEMFNLFDRGARLLLEEFPPFGRAGERADGPPHIVVVGLGSLGESLVVRAAKAWRALRRTAEERVRISVIDRDALDKCASLRVRYPKLAGAADLEALQYEVGSAEFQAGAFLGGEEGRAPVDIVYVCLDNDALALHAGLVLDRRMGSHGVPVVVRMAEEAGLGVLIEDEKSHGRPAGAAAEDLHVFGLLDRTVTPDLVKGGTHEILARARHADYVQRHLAAGETHEMLAQARHESYVERQQQLGDTPETNPSLVPWNRLPAAVQESNRQQVDHIGAELKAIGCSIALQTDWDAIDCEFTDAEVDTMARLEHDLWCEERRREGMVYAPGPKDPKRRTHPDLVPWESLPEAEREKNRAIVRDLPRFLAQAGFQVVR